MLMAQEAIEQLCVPIDAVAAMPRAKTILGAENSAFALENGKVLKITLIDQITTQIQIDQK